MTSRSQFNLANQGMPGTATRPLLNTATTSSAVITKILAGSGITLGSTGVDAGTGDVTVSVGGAITPSSVAATGAVTGSNLSGTNTGDNIGTSGAKVPLLNGTNTWAGAQSLIPGTNYTSITGTQQLSVGESSGNSSYQLRLGYAGFQGVVDALVGAGTGAQLNLNPTGGLVKVWGALSVTGAFSLPVMSMVPTTDYTTLTGVKQFTICEATNNAAYGLRIGFVNSGGFQAVIDSAASGGGTLNLNTSTGPVLCWGGLSSKSATAGVGYSTGAGGAVTQLTSKATGATLNTVSGAVTMNGAALAASTAVSFALTNSAIAATDVLILSIKSGATAGAYLASIDAVAAGSATVTLRNLSAGSLSEAVVINFAVIKAVAA